MCLFDVWSPPPQPACWVDAGNAQQARAAALCPLKSPQDSPIGYCAPARLQPMEPLRHQVSPFPSRVQLYCSNWDH